VIGTVVEALVRHRPGTVVVDPVMVATSGARLLENSALDAMRRQLLPLADVLTPNLPEAELLLGRTIPDVQAMRDAARDLLALGAHAVFLKGGHLPGDGDVVDLYADAEGVAETAHPRLALEAHGTGCTLASAIAARRAQGMAMKEACLAASDYVHAGLRGGYRPGRSDILVLDHFGAAPV
jgi:hydroxymethylpyrimidine/phosphomethylpyrimidine kinase